MRGYPFFGVSFIGGSNCMQSVSSQVDLKFCVCTYIANLQFPSHGAKTQRYNIIINTVLVVVRSSYLLVFLFHIEYFPLQDLCLLNPSCHILTEQRATHMEKFAL